MELDEDNPGAAYHEAVLGFKNGYDAETRQKVTDREIAGKKRTKRKQQYEQKLTKYLSEVDSLGVTVTNYLEEANKDGEVESLVFFYFSENCEPSYVGHIRANGNIAITSDPRVTSIAKAEKYAYQKIWNYVGELSKPFQHRK